MKKHSLKAQKRDMLGRKVKNLRKRGLLPATVYGKKVESVSVSVPTDEFVKVYGEAGETGLIELSIDGDIRPVLVHTVQRHAVDNAYVHVEFHQVDLKEKVHANVPVEYVGDAPAVVNKVGSLMTITDEIEVEALPTDLPEKIDVDVAALAEVDQEIKVSDVKAPHGVEILTDKEQILVRVVSLVSKEAEAAAAEEAAKAAEAANVAPTEGAAPAAEGAEAPAPEKKNEE